MIILNKKYISEIIEQAEGAAPKEACGILAGKDGEAKKLYKLSNISETPELCYLIDPKEQLKVLKEIRRLGLEMTGIYHSHPGSDAYPSAKDIELAFYPDASYVIVSLKDRAAPELKAYRIIDGKITEDMIS